MRNVFIADSALDRFIRATPQPAPTVVSSWILDVAGEIDAVAVAQDRARNADDQRSVRGGRLECVGLFACAPSPVGPSPDKTSCAASPNLDEQDEIGLEGKEDG